MHTIGGAKGLHCSTDFCACLGEELIWQRSRFNGSCCHFLTARIRARVFTTLSYRRRSPWYPVTATAPGAGPPFFTTRSYGRRSPWYPVTAPAPVAGPPSNTG